MHVEGLAVPCVNTHMRQDSPIKTVRGLLGLTQDVATARAVEKGSRISRDEWVKVERGTNKASTARIRKALADGLGLDVPTVEGLLAGSITPSDAAQRVRVSTEAPRAPSTGEHLAASSASPDDRAISLYESALLRAVDHELHTIADLAAAKGALMEAAKLTGSQPDLRRVAREWLDAARDLRLAGLPATAAAISARIALAQRVA